MSCLLSFVCSFAEYLANICSELDHITDPRNTGEEDRPGLLEAFVPGGRMNGTDRKLIKTEGMLARTLGMGRGASTQAGGTSLERGGERAG